LSAEQIRHVAAAIGDVNEDDADRQLEQLGGQVVGGAIAAGRIVDLAGIGRGIGDEFGERSQV
jgi:hypothetical protein